MTHPTPPKAVIFDIGNVLITWQPEARFDAIIGAEKRKEMFAAVDLHHMNEMVDRGGDFQQVIYDTADRYPQFRNEIRMWHDNWLDLASPVIEHSVHLLYALKNKGVLVFALSNFGIGSFALSEQQHAFLKAFDRRYISGHMGVTKPDARIYEKVEADCNIAPKDLLFTDDRRENIDAAKARGWQTHLFDGPKGFAAKLVATGLLSKAQAFDRDLHAPS
ncbi:MAG: HAD family hydrolase [Maritimibacter sp.]